jgi:ParB-like chromosome segregation protein Spo0J
VGSKQAIDAARFSGFVILPEKVIIIGRDTKHKSRQEHKLWDERAYDEPADDDRLLNSIRAKGVKTPIAITKDGDDILVVDGRERVIRARIVNKERLKAGAEEHELVHVKCVYEKVSDNEAQELMVAFNISVPENPMVLAKKVADIVASSSKEHAAKAAGITVQTIEQWLSLPTLHQKVQDAVEAGQLTPTNAAKLAVLKKEDQVAEMEKAIADGTSSRELAARVRNVKKATKAGKSADDAEETIIPPKRRLAKKVIAAAQSEKMFDFTETALARWAIGDLSIGQVKKGFADLVHKVESGKYKPPKK